MARSQDLPDRLLEEVVRVVAVGLPERVEAVSPALADLLDRPDRVAARSLRVVDPVAPVLLPEEVVADADAELLEAVVAGVADQVDQLLPAGVDVELHPAAAVAARQTHGESGRSRLAKASITCRCWVPS